MMGPSSRTYLDYNATAPLRPQARAAMITALDLVGNPSSVHTDGRAARAVIECAREDVARLVGAEPADVVFTSGATEANAWAMGGGWDVIVAAGIEHDSVLAPARASSGRVLDPGVCADGRVRPDRVAAVLAEASAMRGPAARLLVSLQLANNETGVLQPVAEVARLARAHGAVVHCDAVQAAGRMPIDCSILDVDLLAVSAHKLGGPKGVGALVLRGGRSLPPLIAGGGQERRRRAGTENVAAIAGFGAAARAALDHAEEAQRLRRLRDQLEARLLEATPDAVLVGRDAHRLPNTSCIAMPGQAADVLVIKLDLAGVAVSAGAACSSGKVGPSTVLAAMQLDPALARAAIRVSLGWGTSERDLESFLTAWVGSVSTARHSRRVA